MEIKLTPSTKSGWDFAEVSLSLLLPVAACCSVTDASAYKL